MNLIFHIPNDDSWMAAMAAKIGWENLIDYYDKVFNMLYDMQPNTVFDIVANVHPKNYDIFIKSVFSCINELHKMGIKQFSFEEKATQILRK